MVGGASLNHLYVFTEGETMEEKVNIVIEDISIEEVANALKEKVVGTTEVKHITTYAGGMLFALLGYKGALTGLVEYTCYRNQLHLHQYTPVHALISVWVVMSLEEVAKEYNEKHNLLGD